MSGERQISLFRERAPGDGDGRSEVGSAEVPEGREGRDERALPAPGATPESAVPVSRLNAAVRALLEDAFRPVWVVGEMANWRRVASGHCYFSLRDASAQIECAMFRADVRRLPTEPEEGMELFAFGQVSLYEARGRYQLVVRELEAKGAGLWRLALERLRRKLAAEGLLDPARKRPLPRFPGRVGIVTSRTGAALRDVVSVIRRRAPWTHIVVCGCRVQGEGAASGIAAALRRVGGFPGVDVVILARGGGSAEDLWCFNDEELARGVAACPVPVISAVGHEIDVTIVDLVADVRAPTPSAAAELAVPDSRELRRRVGEMAQGLVAGLRGRVALGGDRSRRASERLFAAMARRLERWEGRLGQAGARLDALSPLGTLRRGYAVPLGPEGEVLRRLAMFREGAPFRLRVVDGVVACRTEGGERLPEDGNG